MSKEHPQSTPGHAKPMPGQADDANDHSMKDEEQLGWDQAPEGSDQQTPHRHPRQEGQGGAPDEELSLEESQATGDSPAKPDDPEANK